MLSSVLLATVLSLTLASETVSRVDLNRATFERAWTIVNERYWDPAFGGLDWEAVHDELLPRALAAANTGELRAVLEEMIGRLGQSHFAVLPGPSPVAGADQPPAGEDSELEAAAPASSPLEAPADERAPNEPNEQTPAEPPAADGAACRPRDRERAHQLLQVEAPVPRATPGFGVAAVDGAVLVGQLEPGRAAERAGIALGWEVVSVGGERLAVLLGCLDAAPPVATALSRQLVAALLDGRAGSTVAVAVRAPQGELAAKVLERSVPAGSELVRFGNLPEMDFQFEARRVPVDRAGRGGSALVVRWNVWMMPVLRRFEGALLDGGLPDGLVIDLRNNPGGVGGLAMGIAGYLFDSAQSLGTMRTRSDHIEFRFNPRSIVAGGGRYEPYRGKVALLVDGWTASTSEIFAAALQDLGRGRVFGSRTMGAALPSALDPLPNGDLLYNAIADFLRPAGGRIEGEGVAPDHEVTASREALLQGRDAALEAALSWLADAAPASIESETVSRQNGG